MSVWMFPCHIFWITFSSNHICKHPGSIHIYFQNIFQLLFLVGCYWSYLKSHGLLVSSNGTNVTYIDFHRRLFRIDQGNHTVGYFAFLFRQLWFVNKYVTSNQECYMLQWQIIGGKDWPNLENEEELEVGRDLLELRAEGRDCDEPCYVAHDCSNYHLHKRMLHVALTYLWRFKNKQNEPCFVSNQTFRGR